MKPTYLVMVGSANNNNKWYKIIPDGDYFNVEYGRVGTTGFQTARYHSSQYDSKVREKLKKGYVDQTNLVKDLIQDITPTNSTHKPIENKAIREIVERLQAMARQTVEKNYTISSNKVTQAMVDEAQKIIYELNNNLPIDRFNDILLRLFTTIPRKMGKVVDYLAKDKSDYNDIISTEQDLLDVMAGQIVKPVVRMDNVTPSNDNARTILEEKNLVFEECSIKDIELIKRELGSCASRFYKAWKIENINSKQKYNQYLVDKNIKKTKLLWHGTRSENVWSIVQSSLVLRPNAVITGKLLGFGCYFAPKAEKSLGYTSVSGSYWARGSSGSGFMLLFETAYGKPYDCSTFNGMSDLTEEKLKRLDPTANCVHAHAGSYLRNDEIVFYNESAMNMKYLVELK